jgi:hypothetical protein
MCGCSKLSEIQRVKVIGSPIGGKKPKPGSEMIDGDGDGKCQEEGGKWVPCPPGVGDGNVVDAAGKIVRAVEKTTSKKKPTDPIKALIEARRKKAADKAASIANEGEKAVSSFKREYAREIAELIQDLEDADPRVARRARRDIKDKISEAFSHNFLGLDGKEYSVEVEEVEFTGTTDIGFAGVIKNARGTEIGNFERTFDLFDNSVTHNLLMINEASQGSGIASALNARNEALYREMGLQRVIIPALSTPEKYSGATHWPKNGYDWADGREKIDFLVAISGALNKHRQTADKDGSSDLFASNEEYEIVKALHARAQSEDFGKENNLVAGDLLYWKGAEGWFKKGSMSLTYAKDI